MDNHGLRDLSPQAAQRAVHALIGGEPPALDLVDLVSVGLERDMKTFELEYFSPSSFVVSPETRGSTFKLVEAYYGGGKTHYLRAVERTAHRANFATAFVNLKKDECPLTRFDLVFTAVAESLTVSVRDNSSTLRGIAAVIRHWVEASRESPDDLMVAVQRQIDAVGDLPLASVKVALRAAALAHASGDEAVFEEALVYLTSGKIGAGLRRRGVLQPIDAKNGSLALRTVAVLVKSLGYSGFVLILDEGDRSLSLGTAKDKKAASNNLVQLINETVTDGAWPSTMLLYSIPSWQSFSDAFSDNQALIQRTELTGFPLVPPAPRVVLDDRQRSSDEKREFCAELANRLHHLFEAAQPTRHLPPEVVTSAAQLIADGVLSHETESTFRRLFVQSFLAALYVVERDGALTPADAELLVTRQASEIAKSGR